MRIYFSDPVLEACNYLLLIGQKTFSGQSEARKPDVSGTGFAESKYVEPLGFSRKYLAPLAWLPLGLSTRYNNKQQLYS